MKKLIYAIIPALLGMTDSYAQYTTDKVVGKKNQEYLDSVKNSEYPYALPILGKKAHQQGFSLPYSAGLSLNFLTQQSDIIIDNLSVGFNGGEMYDLGNVVRFNSAVSKGSGLNLRPDIWLFPFLNVYGVLAKSALSTSIDAGLWIPQNDSVWQEVLPLSTKAEFNATTLGFGLTPTIGVGGFFMAFDMNMTWSDVPALEKPAFAFVFDPRIGKNFVIRDEMNVAVWAGGFRLKINSGTTGSLPVSDLFSLNDAQQKIDDGQMKVEQGYTAVDEWWNSLTEIQQQNPVNSAKYNTANKALETAGTVLAAAEQTVNNLNNSTVEYSLDKRQKDMWNFIVGGQFQLNKHWMARGEVGFLSARTQGLVSLQYRFGL
ncbi:MAG: hypothetical protein K1X61_15955 [Chitinophagales bacterium]|nr:hypothetical protein [Chitinophagales bacterium]